MSNKYFVEKTENLNLSDEEWKDEKLTGVYKLYKNTPYAFEETEDIIKKLIHKTSYKDYLLSETIKSIMKRFYLIEKEDKEERINKGKDFHKEIEYKKNTKIEKLIGDNWDWSEREFKIIQPTLFKSAIDFIGEKGNNIFIIDFKSSKSLKSYTKKQVEWQLSLYYYWAKNHFPNKTINIGFILKEDKPSIRWIKEPINEKVLFCEAFVAKKWNGDEYIAKEQEKWKNIKLI